MLHAALFFIALLYSSVGHGGGSGYLAVFHLLGVEAQKAATMALTLNLIVSASAFFNYRKHFSLHQILPFVAVSVPAAYIGGSLNLSGNTVRSITGVFVLLAGLRMFSNFKPLASLKDVGTFRRTLISAAVGFSLGVVAGAIGIGGGIFLSPVLLFLGYGPKETASMSAFFILVNSASGLAARLRYTSLDVLAVAVSALVVLIGGFVGSFWAANHLGKKAVRTLLGFVLLVAGLKLLFG